MRMTLKDGTSIDVMKIDPGIGVNHVQVMQDLFHKQCPYLNVLQLNCTWNRARMCQQRVDFASKA